MKTQRYRFEQAVQEVKEDTKEWLIDEFKSVLESDKDFTRKADYIGFSIASLDAKVASLDEEIKELQELKKKLKSAKTIALEVGAEVFSKYGIDKIEGAGISSITVTNATTKVKKSLEILNSEALIEAGYSKLVLDEDAVQKALSNESTKELVSQYCCCIDETITSPSKLKVNKRRGANTNNYTNLEEMAS